MGQHTVASFDADLRHLNGLVVEMGATVGGQVEEALEALKTREADRAQKIISSDPAVDRLQLKIEENAIEIIAKRQPVAVDLREIIATLKIANDLERMGDLAKNTAKRILAMRLQTQPPEVASSLTVMGQRVLEQVSRVMLAYAQRSDEIALEVWGSDGDIDGMHTSLFRELLTYMMEDPRNIGYCTHLLFCAKNLERIGDHATNIAEIVHFAVTGKMISVERPKRDTSSAAAP
jgi:phosphate transport system protein